MARFELRYRRTRGRDGFPTGGKDHPKIDHGASGEGGFCEPRYIDMNLLGPENYPGPVGASQRKRKNKKVLLAGVAGGQGGKEEPPREKGGAGGGEMIAQLPAGVGGRRVKAGKG